MEIAVATVLLFTLITVSADRDPRRAEDTPVTEHAHQSDAAVRADLSGYPPSLPACGPGVLYRNLSVPVERAVYWTADGRHCNPEGSS